MKHKLPKYLREPVHPITVYVIGCGGTGSYVVTQLAKIAKALRELRNIELFVTVVDDDVIEEHNIGRQLFSPADIGAYKANVIVERVNRFYGLDWKSFIGRMVDYIPECNILITCTDNLESRYLINSQIHDKREDPYIEYTHNERYDHNTNFYWMDFGNSKDTGQYILSTFFDIKQARKAWSKNLPTLFDLYGNIKERKQEPSCSMAESLNRQDLFINLQLAAAGVNLLWKLLKDHEITYHGQFMNSSTGETRPIKL